MTFLQQKRLKAENDNILTKKDKELLTDLMVENKIKTSKKLQKKNIDKIMEIEESFKEAKILLNSSLKDIITNFYNSGDEFEVFRKKMEKIDNNFKETKRHHKNQYSLLDIENIGFIRMIEDDCGLSYDKKEIVKKMQDYLNKKGTINVEIIQNCKNELNEQNEQ